MKKSYKISNMKGRRVLITGGLGFIGSNLAHKLVSLDAEVTILDGKVEPYGWNLFNIRGIENEIQFIKGDIRNRKLIERTFKKHEYDYIFHLAAQVGREISMNDPYKDLSINCEGMLNLLEICRKSKITPKIVYSGTRGQIGEPEYLPVNEKHPTNPTDIYGVNKLAAEKYLLIYHRVYDIPAVSIRLNNVYGPRCQIKHCYYGILNWFIRLALEEDVIPVYGDGLQTRDYVYIDDVIDAFCLSVQKTKANGEIYFVGSGEETVFLDVVKEIINIVGKGKYKHVPFPPEREKIDIRRFVTDYSKIRKDLSWHPTTTLKEGIKKTVEFYKKNLKKYL